MYVGLFVYQRSLYPSVAMGPQDYFGQILSILFMGLFCLFAVIVYHYLTRKYVGIGFDKETHCRKCGYILKGITEPRCSECGEQI